MMLFPYAHTMKKLTIECKNLVRYLGKDEARHKVLDGVSLKAYAGKVYSIIGPSGCGKSTMLYLLGLLDKPEEGEIFVGDVKTSSLSDSKLARLRNRSMGFVFQFHFLIKEFTAAENVMLPMKKLGVWSEKKMRDRAHYLLDEVGLGKKVDRRANHLSGGEQQRVAIARSLANQPSIILADEPTGNLDSANSDRVFDLMRKIVHEENLTLILVTHNPEIAERSDYTMEMEDGKIGKITELKVKVKTE